MKKYFIIITFFLASFLAGCCCPFVNEDAFLGVWINEEENCKIQLYKDFSFKASNLPFDVTNEYYLNPQTIEWQGVWVLKGEEIKLSNKNNYYYLNFNCNLFSSKVQLYIQLLDEVGGSCIHFHKQ